MLWAIPFYGSEDVGVWIENLAKRIETPVGKDSIDLSEGELNTTYRPVLGVKVVLPKQSVPKRKVAVEKRGVGLPGIASSTDVAIEQ